ncbi:GumC family protein [Vibrio maerlii]|uniref:GumC family protein n=1 Tax=Vibrio maerlii TaxID=2231648 RepID=UPI000E3ECCB0|nr:GNVR domain-containing protein [Vibrio maerlii]
MNNQNNRQLKERFVSIILAAWRRRWIIALPMLLLPIIALFVSKVTPTTYKAHTSMLIQETAKMNPFLQDIAVSTMLNDRLNAIQTLLKSRHVLGMVAEELGLIDDQNPNSEREKVIASIASQLKVQQIGKDLLKIEYSSSNPDGMKELLESVSRHFIEQILAPERSSITDSSEFLNQHIEKRLISLQESEENLAKYTNEHTTLTPELQSQTYARLATLKQSLAEKQAELSGVERSLGSLDQQLSQTNPVVGRIEDQIIETRSELTLLQAKYTNNHSAVQAKQRELKRLEAERETLLASNQPNLNADQLWDMASSQQLSANNAIQPLLMTQLASLQQERGRYESLKEETNRLGKMITELEVKAHSFGDHVKEIFRLQRNVEMKRQLYEELLQRYEMAQLTGSLGRFEESKRVKVIDLPYTPTRPSNLPTIIFIIAGIFGGCALGIGLAIILEFFDSTIRNAQDIANITDIPILTTLPRFQTESTQIDSQIK